MLIEVEILRKSLESTTSVKIFALFINAVTSCFKIVPDLVTQMAHGRLHLVTVSPEIKLHYGNALFSCPTDNGAFTQSFFILISIVQT